MWKKANRQAAERFSTLEKLTVIRAAKSETPAELAFRLGQPNQVDNLVTLRGTISSKRFSEFQDSFKTDLLSDADKLTSRISAFDRPTLNMLLSREEQNIYRRIGKSIDSINDTRIRSVIDAQTESGAIIHDLLLNGKTASINKIHEIVEKSGGKESPLGKSIRAGIIDSIADKTIRRSRGSKVIDPNALEKSIAELEKKGLLRFLNRSDVEQLADLDKVAPFLKVKSDTGTSIQKATTAANTRGAIVGVLTGQGFAGSAISTVLEHLGVGTLFTSKVGRWLLTILTVSSRKITRQSNRRVNNGLVPHIDDCAAVHGRRRSSVFRRGVEGVSTGDNYEYPIRNEFEWGDDRNLGGIEFLRLPDGEQQYHHPAHGSGLQTRAVSERLGGLCRQRCIVDGGQHRRPLQFYFDLPIRYSGSHRRAEQFLRLGHEPHQLPVHADQDQRRGADADQLHHR
jgi:hypothetical protein